jgi:hypothetical protein
VPGDLCQPFLFGSDPSAAGSSPVARFYFEEFGIGNIEVHKLSPAVESMPSLKSLPEDFREAFFGGLDYGNYGEEALISGRPEAP